MVIAMGSTLVSLLIGTWIAILLSGRRFFRRALIFSLTILPAVVPGIISTIAYRIYARLLGIEPGIWSHAVHNVPIVVLVVVARLSTLPANYNKAARQSLITPGTSSNAVLFSRSIP